MDRSRVDNPEAGSPPGGNGNGKKGIDSYVMGIIRNKAMKAVGKAGLKRGDLEDIKQELVLFLLERIPMFDSRKAKWNTFVARLLDRKIASMIKSRLVPSRDHRRCDRSLQEPVRIDEESFLLLEETLTEEAGLSRIGRFPRPREEQRDLMLDLGTVVSNLPSRFRILCELLKCGSVSAVSRATGFNRTYLHECILKIRTRLEGTGITGYLEPDRRREP